MRDTLDAREPWEDMLEMGDSGAGDVAIVACALLSGVRIMVLSYISDIDRSKRSDVTFLLSCSIYHPLGTPLH